MTSDVTKRARKSNIQRLWERAQRSLVRVTPVEAAEDWATGALLIDLRNEQQRRTSGTIPNALVIDRSVLEWRLDPTSPWRVEVPFDHDTRIILICAEGYSSTLAALSLKKLGLRRVTDVIGGFNDWAESGLPVVREAGEPAY